MELPSPGSTGQDPPSPPPRSRRGVSPRARLLDRLARCLIAGGGIGIIAAVLGIFVFVARETYPLLGEAETERTGSIGLAAGPPLAVGVDPYREIAFVVVPGGLEFRRLPSGEVVRRIAPGGSGQVIVTAACHRGGQIALGLSDGSVRTGTIRFETRFLDGQRAVTPVASFAPPLQLHAPGDPPVRLSCRGDGERRSVLASISAAGDLKALISTRKPGPAGHAEVEEAVHDLTGQLPALPRSVVVDGRGRQLLAGTDSGEIIEWSLGGRGNPTPVFPDSERLGASGNRSRIPAGRPVARRRRRLGGAERLVRGAGARQVREEEVPADPYLPFPGRRHHLHRSLRP